MNLKPLKIGKITPVYRMLKTQYRYVLQVPYYDFERKIGAEAEYLHEQLAKLHEADGNGNVNSMYHDLAPEEHQVYILSITTLITTCSNSIPSILNGPK